MSPCKTEVGQQSGESLVFIGNEPAALAHMPLRREPLRLRSTYLPGPDSIEYVEGRDYVIDYITGTLRRTADSRVPDFRKNMLFSQENFDHSKFPGFGNKGYFAFADYSFAQAGRWPAQPQQRQFLRATETKLKAGKAVRIVAYGDSITAGGDASESNLIFWQRWADELQRKYPQARIIALNRATVGDSTVQGSECLDARVLKEDPDLVLIGFGMNDHNINGVPIPRFEDNLKTMIERVRQDGAEVVLLSAFPPNPKWKFGTHCMEQYAAATAKVAREMQCAYADVFNNWQIAAARKKPEDLLGNNINHPNDFGHWIYFQVLVALGL